MWLHPLSHIASHTEDCIEGSGIWKLPSFSANLHKIQAIIYLIPDRQQSLEIYQPWGGPPYIIGGLDRSMWLSSGENLRSADTDILNMGELIT